MASNIIFLSFLFPSEMSFNETDKVYNAFLMGMDDKAQELALEIISDNKYLDQRENTLYMLSEYYFSEAIKNDSFDIAERAYAFYHIFLNDYPNSEKCELVLLRVNFLNTIFKELQLTGEYLSKTYNAFQEIKKLIGIASLYERSDDYKNKEIKDPDDQFDLFIDTKNPFQIADKYYDNIILNYPEFASYGYYFKIKNYLSNSHRWYSTDWMAEIGEDVGLNNYKLTIEIVYSMLQDVRNDFPNNEYILELHVMFASTIWNASRESLRKKDKKNMAQKLLQYVVENDKNKLGFRYNVVKEFIIRNL